jgi:glycosyltransferase involved in cell wall biosynthesis
MAAGLPVVGSELAGSTPDFVEPGRTGWLVDPSSCASFLNGLVEALDGRERWPEFGAAARRVAEANSPARSATAILRALDLAQAKSE